MGVTFVELVEVLLVELWEVVLEVLVEVVLDVIIGRESVGKVKPGGNSWPSKTFWTSERSPPMDEREVVCVLVNVGTHR